jgi:hypothetical protein
MIVSGVVSYPAMQVSSTHLNSRLVRLKRFVKESTKLPREIVGIWHPLNPLLPVSHLCSYAEFPADQGLGFLLWVPSDRAFKIVVILFGILILLLFFKPAVIMSPVYRIVDLFR